MKLMQNQQGVQGVPYQDANQVNANFSPQAQQVAQGMYGNSMVNNSPLNRELTEKQKKKLPKVIQTAIKKA